MIWNFDVRSCLRAKGSWLVTVVWLFVLFFPGAQFSAAQEQVVTPEKLEPPRVYSPYADRDYPEHAVLPR